MAKARYRLTRTARQDLADIGRYTERQWGVAQRRAYLAQLDASLDLLVDHPQTGVARDDIRHGYRCLREDATSSSTAPQRIRSRSCGYFTSAWTSGDIWRIGRDRCRHAASALIEALGSAQ